MPEINQFPRFFLGANSACEFHSIFEQLYNPNDNWQAFLLKGGPGTGKSSFMKDIANEFINDDNNIEFIYCSSDPNSLDAIILNNKKICIVDATSPHALEPKFPGACETLINLGDCWDYKKLLENKKNIIDLTTNCSALHIRSQRYLEAANNILKDSYHLALNCTDTIKIARYAGRLAKREFTSNKQKLGIESLRFLSATTPFGVIFFNDTIKNLCDKVYVIEDTYSAVSRILLSHIRNHALAASYDIISCYCTLSPNEKLEHIIIPELKLGFVTSNRYHTYTSNIYRKIHFQRFTDIKNLNQYKNRLNFNKKAVKELINEASNLILEAKNLHDNLEEYYINAMDFDKIKIINNDILERIRLIK